MPSDTSSPDSLDDLPKVWKRLAYCESRYQLRAVSVSGDHYGLWQIHKGFYKALNIDPKKATFNEQWKAAKYVYARQGAKAWSCAKRVGLK